MFEIMEWVSPKQRLPEKSGDYMVDYNGYYTYTQYNKELNVFNCTEDMKTVPDYAWQPEKVSFWADIPKPDPAYPRYS